MILLTKNSLLKLILCASITSLVIYCLSGTVFYISHPILIIFLTVAVAVIISNFITSKIIPSKDK